MGMFNLLQRVSFCNVSICTVLYRTKPLNAPQIPPCLLMREGLAGLTNWRHQLTRLVPGPPVPRSLEALVGAVMS